MKTIYCISGLGADERAFSKLKIDGYNLNVIRWLQPQPAETIESYAARMRTFIEEDNPVLMGLSFGGMLCTEIAKQVPVKKIILISSIRCCKELPWWMRMVAVLRLHKIFPLRSTKFTQPFQNRMLGAETEEERSLAAIFRKEVGLEFTKWAIHQAINWKNNWQHPNVYHIHGENDHMFPVKYCKPDRTIPKGGHFIIMNRADEVSVYVRSILQED
jgi:pimeloyl-ACP methyl ester carboxylesterase